MGLLSFRRGQRGPQGNRWVSRTSLDDVESTKRSKKAPKNVKAPKNLKTKGASSGRKARVSGGRFGLGVRKLGAVIWPERFPEIAAARSKHSPDRKPIPRGFIWIWALALVIASAAFIVHLNIRFDIIQTGYSLSRAQAEQRRLRLSQRELRLELATLKEPGRIEAQARTELGMERPEHERIIRLDGRRPRLARRDR